MTKFGFGRLAGIAALVGLLPLAAASEGFEVGSKGIRYTTPDGSHELRLGGRFHLDGYIYDADAPADARIDALDDDVDVRRLRAYLSGKHFDGDFRFKVEGEMAPDRVGWRNVWGAYRGIDDVEFKVGNYIAPVGFEDLLSSNDHTFMERSLASALAPGFLAGGSAGAWGRHWSVSVGGFTDPLGGDDIEKRKSHGLSAVGRVTFAPWRKKRQLLHLGGSFEWRDVDSDSAFRLRTRPESGGADRLVDTGNLFGVDRSLTFGLEAAAVLGPWSLQGEYLRAHLERSFAPNPAFQGGYVQLSWFATGESRRYSSRRAVFRSVEPRSRWGALELALRYSALDLVDEDVVGGKEQNVTFGLNWYLNRNLRMMFNFVQVDADRRVTLETDRPRIYQLRLQAVL
ncbi:MAG TPA: porin [Myxococcota bacterium]